MKKLHGLVAAGLFLFGATVLAQETQPNQGSQGGGTYTAPSAQPGTGSGNTAPSGRQAVEPQRQATTQTGAQEVSGTITEIDHDKGAVSLRTNEGLLRLHFQPAAIRHLKRGESITAELAFWQGSATGMERAGDVPEARAATKHAVMGKNTVTGMVRSIDHDKGTFALNTDKGVLQLAFPSTTVRSLNDGDRITVQMAYFKTKASHKMK